MESLYTMNISVLRTLVLTRTLLKYNDYNLSTKVINGFLNIKITRYIFFTYQESISLTILDGSVIVYFNTRLPRARRLPPDYPIFRK